MPEFPRLAEFLRKVRSGADEGDDVYHLLCGQDDAEFRRRTAKMRVALDAAILEIQQAAVVRNPRQNAPDLGHIRYVLWHAIRNAREANTSTHWDSAEVGLAILDVCAEDDHAELILVPALGSASPFVATPKAHSLVADIWLFEGAGIADKLITQFEQIGYPLNNAAQAQLREIKPLSATPSDFDDLLKWPLVVCLSRGWRTERPRVFRRFGFPLLSLRNLVQVMNPNVQTTLRGYMTRRDINNSQLIEEWRQISLGKRGGYWGAYACGKWQSISGFHLRVGEEEKLSPVHWAGRPYPPPPPMIILPSLMAGDAAIRLINYAEACQRATATNLDRRIMHAVVNWCEAAGHAQTEDWEIGFEEYDESPTISNPEALILHSTIVLETLLSPEGGHEDITTRIAEMTAGLLGNTPTERYNLVKRMRELYDYRSRFVHGATERREDEVGAAFSLFTLASLALWRTIELRVFHGKVQDCREFHDLVIRRKFGIEGEGPTA